MTPKNITVIQHNIECNTNECYRISLCVNLFALAPTIEPGCGHFTDRGFAWLRRPLLSCIHHRLTRRSDGLLQNFPQGISIGNFELSVCCFVASNGPGSVCCCIPHNWSKKLGDISSMKVRDWEKGSDRERGTEKEKKARKRVIERGLRPVEIHHNVRHADILRPHIHHCSRIWRHKWTQETGDEEWSEGR